MAGRLNETAASPAGDATHRAPHKATTVVMPVPCGRDWEAYMFQARAAGVQVVFVGKWPVHARNAQPEWRAWVSRLVLPDREAPQEARKAYGQSFSKVFGWLWRAPRVS